MHVPEGHLYPNPTIPKAQSKTAVTMAQPTVPCGLLSLAKIGSFTVMSFTALAFCIYI